jgi:hypothetical protein
MIENYRSGLIWRLMRSCPYIAVGLRRAGFRGGWLTGLRPTAPASNRETAQEGRKRHLADSSRVTSGMGVAAHMGPPRTKAMK